jgi:glutamyl-tRNA synthetase
MPHFAHLPLILKPDGNGKLSKRDGDRLGFPVFPISWNDPLTHDISKGYKDYGFVPDAFLNMLALLGWNPGNDLEIMSLNEMIQHFTIDRIGKSGAKFDWEKARWINHQYLSRKSDEELAGYLQILLQENGLNFDNLYVTKVIGLIRERIFLIPDLWTQSWFFFTAPGQYDQQVVRKIWQPDTASLVSEFAKRVSEMHDFSKDTLHAAVQDFVALKGIKTGALMNPLRLLTVGSNQGPGMMDLAETLGKTEFLSRIEAGLKNVYL